MGERRRERDLNPRYRKLYNRLAIYRDRPLCHLSIDEGRPESIEKLMLQIYLINKEGRPGPRELILNNILRRWLRLDLNLRPRAYESPTLTN